ncbi:MAG TPA: Gfo/Idh/MocA family oxidoreductase [Chloroflexota bacterium]|jgi:predicted dehydrogenase|nr:Gfo/Idh/MocA family oxidoreductase [Chloroflexota bacterium]
MSFRAVVPTEVPELGIGMIGYEFMGRAHANAYRKIPYTFWPPPVQPRLVAVCGRTEERVAEAARRYGFEGYYTDWRELVADERIGLIDNCAWHDAHAEPAIAAAEAGKHLLCEKPLALTAADARRMRDAAVRAGVKHMTAFNYRFAPAVRLAREIVEQGLLGRVHHLRVSYLQDHQADPETPYPWAGRPSGVLLGLGSHAIDLARFLVGEPSSVTGYVRTLNVLRPRPDGSGRIEVEDDDAALAQVEFVNGALGTIEAAWICAGRKNQLAFEINGAMGSIAWDLEDLNRLHVYLEDADKVAGTRGFENVLVTEAHHPYHQTWWPFGHILGWEHLHVNLVHHLLRAVASGEPVEPWGATFEDGYRAAVVTEAILESSRSGRRVEVAYE